MKRLERWDVWFYCADGWKVYAQEIPEDRLIQGNGGTAALERNNGRQRHWFARFRRKSVVVLKSLHMVELTMALFARFHVHGTREDSNAFFC